LISDVKHINPEHHPNNKNQTNFTSRPVNAKNGPQLSDVCSYDIKMDIVLYGVWCDGVQYD